MKKLASLKYIWLDNNQITTVQGLDKLTRDLSYLQEISLEENKIPEKEIREFQANHSNIQVLY